MSTRIYNGYKLKKNYSIFELSEWIDELKEDLEELSKETFLKDYAATIAWVLNRMAQGRYEDLLNEAKNVRKYSTTESLEKETLGYFTHELLSGFYEHNKKNDLKTSMVILPTNFVEDEDNKLLLMFFTEQPGFKERFEEETEYIEPYPYWNNSEGPEELSQKEWEDRKIDWTFALGPTMIPSDRGFIIELVKDIPHYFQLDKAKVLELMPTQKMRAKDLASNQILGESYDQSSDDPVGNVLRASREMDTVHKERLDQLMQEWLVKLFDITEETMKTSIKELKEQFVA